MHICSQAEGKYWMQIFFLPVLDAADQGINGDDGNSLYVYQPKASFKI